MAEKADRPFSRRLAVESSVLPGDAMARYSQAYFVSLSLSSPVLPGVRHIAVLYLTITVTPGLTQRVHHIDTYDGLCTNSLTDLKMDHLGNLWIGSYGGLMKYSGTRIQCLGQAGQGKNELSSLEMHSLWEDNCGYIWAATTGGLDRIDPMTYEVTHYSIKSPVEGVSSIGYIYSVFQDAEEFIWFSTDVALFKLDPITGYYEPVPETRDKHGVIHYNIGFNSFIGTAEGIWFRSLDGMMFYDYQTRLFYHRYHNPASKRIFNLRFGKKFADHSDMRMDDHGRLWIVYDHRKLLSYDITLDQIDTFQFEVPDQAWPCCYSVGIDGRNNIWVGTRHGGAVVFDTEKHIFRSLNEEGANKILNSDYIYSFERGNGDQMFVSHDNGLDIVDLYDRSLRELKISDEEDFLNLKHQSGDISYSEERGILYIPFYHYGIIEANLETGEFIRRQAGNNSIAYVRASGSQPYYSAKGNLYALPEQGTVLSLQERNLLPTAIAGMSGLVVWDYVENPTSTYLKLNSGWLVHLFGDTVEVMACTHFKPNVCVSVDSQYLYFLNDAANLVRRKLADRSNDTIPLQQMLEATEFSFSNARHMADDGSSIWMTGQNGMLRYNYVKNTVTGYTMSSGLSHSFNFAVVKDQEGQIWVGNLGGIDKYDPVTDRFAPMHRIKETSYMDAFGHALCTTKGDLIFHFGNKLYTIDPREMRNRQREVFKLRLNEVLVNGEHVDWRETSNLERLTYDQNRITFTYDIGTFGKTDVLFQYRIDGGDWISNGKRTEVHLDGLAHGKYLFEVTTQSGPGNPEAEPLRLEFIIKAPFWKTWWFIALLSGLVVATALVLMRRNVARIHAQNKIDMQITQLKSTALRAQMNPHFVFNCLNAIQECVVTGKVDEAYTYLSKFSRLLRLVLEYSDRSEISLQQEMEILDLYISLEKLRFKESFAYTLSADHEIEAEQTFIPPMLIQPHIENAIWHGLRHLQGEKQLVVEIQEHADYMQVIVTDNGIGRKKAMELKSSRIGSGHGHTSKGLAISAQRIELLQKQFPETCMEVEDLYDASGKPTGTKVTLRLPILPYVSKEGGSKE